MRDAKHAQDGVEHTGFRVQDGRQPGDGTRVILAPPAQVTDPGGEIGNGNQFFVKPGKVGDLAQVQDPGLALGALVCGLGCFVQWCAPMASFRMDTPALDPIRLAPAAIMASASA